MEHYVGGAAGRAAEIEAGSTRPAQLIVDDALQWAARLDGVFANLPDHCWARPVATVQGGEHPVAQLPFRRWREVEIHLADLDLGFTSQDWSAAPHASKIDNAATFQSTCLALRLRSASSLGVVAEMAARTTHPLCVVLDSNQWRSQYGLRSRVSAALLFLVQQHRGQLGLPEVVESEIVPLLVAEGRSAVHQVNDQLRVLQAITGSHPAVTLPGDEQLTAAVESRLAELESLFVRVPITEEHTRRALARVNVGKSPNRKKEQFKDSLIWEAVLTLAQERDVHLVTDDGAFFAADGKALADDLIEECANIAGSVSIHRNLRPLLQVLQGTAPRLDYENIGRQLFDELVGYLAEVAAKDDLLVGEFDAASVQAFATEDHNRLVLTYELSGELTGDPAAAGGGRRTGRFVVSGEGTFDLSAERVVEAKPGQCQIIVDEDGVEKTSQNILAISAHAYLGAEPPRLLRIREPLDEQ